MFQPVRTSAARAARFSSQTPASGPVGVQEEDQENLHHMVKQRSAVQHQHRGESDLKHRVHTETMEDHPEVHPEVPAGRTMRHATTLMMCYAK
ncbi:unnamed protein product [Merluccius merluccius]